MKRCLLDTEVAQGILGEDVHDIKGYDFIEINMTDDTIDSVWGYRGDVADDFGIGYTAYKGFGQEVEEAAYEVETEE